MIRALSAILLVLTTLQDSPAEVAALIKELESDDISVRDRASKQLIRLGARALPALRERLSTADETLKANLKGIIRTLERSERLAAILAPPSRVTLKVVDTPLEDVFAELFLLTGHRLTSTNIDKYARVSFEVANVEPWEAFDALCRAQGLSWGVRHTPRTDEILVAQKGEWSPRTRFKSAGLTVELTALNEGVLLLVWSIYHGLAAPFRLLRFEVDESKDDAGTDLSQELPWAHNPSCHVPPPKPPERARGSIVAWASRNRIAEGAQKLSRIKGRLIVGVKVDGEGKELHELTLSMNLGYVALDRWLDVECR